jgi:hypothetical protein
MRFVKLSWSMRSKTLPKQLQYISTTYRIRSAFASPASLNVHAGLGLPSHHAASASLNLCLYFITYLQCADLIKISDSDLEALLEIGEKEAFANPAAVSDPRVSAAWGSSTAHIAQLFHNTLPSRVHRHAPRVLSEVRCRACRTS